MTTMIAAGIVVIASCRGIAMGLMPERDIVLRLLRIPMPIKCPYHPVPESRDDKTNDDELFKHCD